MILKKKDTIEPISGRYTSESPGKLFKNMTSPTHWWWFNILGCGREWHSLWEARRARARQSRARKIGFQGTSGCASDGRTWNTSSAEPDPFTLGTLGKARQFLRTAKTDNHALSPDRKKPKVISNRSHHIKVTWAEAPLVGTDFQTIPHLSGSMSLAPMWLLVGSY